MDYMADSKYDNPARVILSLCDHSGAWSRPFIDKGYVVVRVDPKHDPEADQGGTGYTVGAGGTGRLTAMPDGGYGLALTAGALADILEDESGYYLDNLLYPVYADGAFDCCEVAGVLIAAPCTDFAGSGARWWPAKDRDGRTEQSLSIVRDCMRVVEASQADWWCLENPVGRLGRLMPELGPWVLKFDPCDYAGWADDPDSEAYTKATCLWGTFNPALPLAPRQPVMIEKTRKDGTIVRGSWMWATLGGKSERTKELRSVTPTGFARAFAEVNS